MIRILLYLLLLTPCIGVSQLPSSRQVEWTRAGASVSLDNLPIKQVINVVTDLLFDNTGTTNIAGLLNTAITNSSGNTVFYFPPGDYLFTQQVNLKNGCIIKGKSSSSTKFTFNLGAALIHCFNVSGGTSGNRINVASGFSKGSTGIIVVNINDLNVGDYIEIRQDNEPAWDVSPQNGNWDDYAVGQITKIEAINSVTKEITLRDPLTYSYTLSLNPQIIKMNPKQNIGFETFYIERTDDIGDATSRANFKFNWAVECWIKGVESYKASHQHIEMGRTAFVTVSGCYFNDAWRHNNTGGAKAYGLNLIFHTNFCLFENNIFQNLRHSMSIKLGSNGNVLAYNYSYNRKAEECFWILCSWTNDKSDLNFHGHYPFANLAEGNIIDYIHSDKTFGISGPDNTLFRNRTNSSQGIFIDKYSSAVYPDHQSFLGNEILSGSYNLGVGIDQYACENNHAGTLKGSNCVSGLSSNSLYLSSQPSFWSISDTWPSIGGSNTINTGTIPAKHRVDQGLTLTVPAETDLCEDGSVYYDETVNRFRWCENGLWITK